MTPQKKISFVVDKDWDDHGYKMYCDVKGRILPKQQYHRELYNVGYERLKEQANGSSNARDKGRASNP